MVERAFNSSDLDVGEALTLSVGWRSGRKTKLGQLTMASDVAAEIGAIVAATLADLDERSPETWAPDADLSPETYLMMEARDLGEAPLLASEHGELTLAEALMSAESLPVLRPNELPVPDLTFYAITLGDAPGQRVAFLRRANPRRGLRRGRLMTSYSDVLTRIESPVFAFDDLVDLVFWGDSVLVLSQTAFTAIFRSQETLMAQVPGWTSELAQHVTISAQGQERLSAKAIRDSRVKMRLESIVKRGHLADVEPAVISERMTVVGLDAAALLDPEGRLLLEDEDIPSVLQFLNEDLFVGALTSTGFRADKKAVR